MPSPSKTRNLFVLFLVAALWIQVRSQSKTPALTEGSYVTGQWTEGALTLSRQGSSTPLMVSSRDFPGVIKVAGILREDIFRATRVRPELSIDRTPSGREVILVGTLGKNPQIDELVKQRKLDVGDLVGKWEAYALQVVDNPFPGVDRALVIVGCDKRGTIFGMFDLSAEMGISPWYWWADVPVRTQSELYVLPGRYTDGEPAIKYRGIFINDEAPAFSGWAFEKFGGFNHAMYEHVFELILRLKGNYLWPAMWGRAFSADDPENPRLADEYGIVIATSHHEPMMRAHAEWGKGPGTWNYQTNEKELQEFWRGGVERMGRYESVITIGMRGDGDEPMSEGANIALLEKIVADQRRIISEVTGKDASTVPQVWALYKEVQEYYDKGMRVPDDVTLLLCDDNWGNIRKLPELTGTQRRGGYGLYYHYDFVGGPRNYKWLNTNQIERVWEQMHLAYEHGATQIWIVNVGDIKPMEFPIDFFLDFAWNPEAMTPEVLAGYSRMWAAEQFGANHSTEIAAILDRYTKVNSRRKPEMLSPETYSLVHYREAETVVKEYTQVVKEARRIYGLIEPPYKDAFYQLVLHQPEASANLNDLYVTVARNRLYADQGRSATNDLAARAHSLYAKDSAITFYFNNVLAEGKWRHMMDQTHIGYTNWQQPEKNSMPEVRVISVPEAAELGVAIEGSDQWWPSASGDAVLPELDAATPECSFEIFNRGRSPFEYTIASGIPWVLISPGRGTVVQEQGISVVVDFANVPPGRHRVPITVSGAGTDVVIYAVVNNPAMSTLSGLQGFMERDGYVSIEAPDFSRAVDSEDMHWLKVNNLGRTGSAVTTRPSTAASRIPGGGGPRLEYTTHLLTTGEVAVKVFLSPLLNFTGKGIRYAVSFDDEPLQIVNIHKDDTVADWKYPRYWNEMVSQNIRVLTTRHSITRPGAHVLKFWYVDPGVVLQKVVIDTGGLKPCYLGPPPSRRWIPAKESTEGQ